MILDTNALSAILDGDEKLRQLLRSTPAEAVPTIVFGEYLFGLLGSRDYENGEKRLNAFLSDYRMLDVNTQTAIHYATIRNELKQAGKPIPANDLCIAALAQQHDLPFVSRDTHFDTVPGVTRAGW